MKQMINIVIADDHLVWRKGIIPLLEDMKGFRVIGEAADGAALLDLCIRLQPQIVITDIKMPGMDGYTAIQQVRQLPMAPAIIAMSALEEEADIYDSMVKGAKGYLGKHALKHEIQETIERVLFSDHYVYPFRNKHFCKVIATHTFPNLPVRNNMFTTRELQVMEKIAEQKTSKEIAEDLFISPKTVIFHRDKLMKKTGSTSAMGILLFGIRNRLIKGF